MLQKVSIKLGLCPDSSLLSDRVLCNRYFQKVVQVSAEEIFSDIFHLIILSYSFIFFKISFFGTKKPPKTKHQKTNTPPSPQNKPQNFSRRSKKSNFSQSFKRDFSDTLSFSIIINQGEGQELLYLFHSYLFPVQGCHVFLDFESTGAFTTKYYITAYCHFWKNDLISVEQILFIQQHSLGTGYNYNPHEFR